MITKPISKLHSRFRHACLGISSNRYRQFARAAQVGIAYCVFLASLRKDGVESLADANDVAWDVAKPVDTQEATALYFITGVEYGEHSDYNQMRSMALAEAVCDKLEVNEEHFKGGANRDQFIETALGLMGEVPEDNTIEAEEQSEDLTGETEIKCDGPSSLAELLSMLTDGDADIKVTFVEDQDEEEDSNAVPSFVPGEA